MRKIVILAVVLAGCVPGNDPVTVTEPGQLEQRASWQAAITGVAAFANVRGTTQLADFGPYFDAQMSITSAAPSTSYQWRIFPGTCAAPGATQFGPAQAYPNLVTNAAGSATIARTISGPLNLTGAYNVRVSTVATPVTIVACGNLAH